MRRGGEQDSRDWLERSLRVLKNIEVENKIVGIG